MSRLLFSRSVSVQLFETPWKCSTPGFPSFTISRSFLKSMSVESVMPSNHLTLCHHLLFLPSIFPGVRVFPMSRLFASGGWNIGASASASVLPMNIQCWFPLGLTGLISLLSQDSHESSSAPQFESIISSALSLLYDPTLTSVHDYWKNHGLDKISQNALKSIWGFLDRKVLSKMAFCLC